MEGAGSSRNPEARASAGADASSKSTPARLLIVDDHALLRGGMRAMLEIAPDLEVVGEAENGREAVDLCRELDPDLVLMDLSMPEMDGIAATRTIKAEFPKTGVLVLTAHADHNLLLEAIRAGAAGYVLKGVGPAQLVGVVRGTLSGESPVDQELVMQLVRRLAEEARRGCIPWCQRCHSVHQRRDRQQSGCLADGPRRLRGDQTDRRHRER
jgi:DNA-binding NarL/FixJ family response regulator